MGLTKNQYSGGGGEGGGQCANLTEGFARKKRVMFLRGVDTPIHTMLERYQLK